MPSAVVVAGSVPKESGFGCERRSSFFNRLRMQDGRARSVHYENGYRVLLRDANYCHRDEGGLNLELAYALTYFG